MSKNHQQQHQCEPLRAAGSTSSAPSAPLPTHSLAKRHEENLHQFSQLLAQSRFWHVLLQGESDPKNAIGIFDYQTGLLYPADNIHEFEGFLQKNSFTYLQSTNGDELSAILHSTTKLLWNNETSDQEFSLSDGKAFTAKGLWAKMDGWVLPSKDQLYAFATAKDNPYKSNHPYRLKCSNGTASFNWLTSQGYVDTDEGCWSIRETSMGRIFALNPLWIYYTPTRMLLDLVARDYCLRSLTGEIFTAVTNSRWQGLPDEKLLLTLQQEGVSLYAVKEGNQQKDIPLNPIRLNAMSSLVDTDYTPCRLPKLEKSRLYDPDKGLWELWNEPPEILKHFGLIARDPGLDIQRRAVAIDFGTSSTVVAMDTANGGRELLRIGVRDFYQAVQPQHFENPTVLECLDFPAFNTAWTERAYRPLLDWNAMRAAHEAQASFRDNPGDTKILASILPKLKQWALRSDRSRIRLTDRQGREIELAAHVERNPVRGQPLSVTEDYPFDPIELYAWYLGMAINFRERGLFLKYYLSFPVKYPREVKDRILASFRRGLQRSLPQSLIDYHPQVLNDFEVKDWASEPAAYAAAAMAHLHIDPSEVGVPYAVFDFGGGTTDFDFGLLRWANAEEEERGYEQVFEHLASEGDRHLGGENLLEHLVYASFQHNLAALREARIQFTQPIDAATFSGSEAFLAQTQAAQTNTVMLAAKLRAFLERDTADLPPQIKLDLIDADGDKRNCELVFDATALDGLLAKRIYRGVVAFFHELAKLGPELPDDAPVHILLAGNGCRSRYIKALFDTESEAWRELLNQAFANKPPQIVVHPPLPMDENNCHAPTTKTGVALGLLRLVPGENTLLLDHVHQRHDGQAPFAWFVGRLRRRQLDPVLSPGAGYGQWHEVGPLQNGVFNLFVTASPCAHAGMQEGDPELKKYRLDFPAAPGDARLFVRPTGPNTLGMTASPDQTGLATCTTEMLTLE